MEVVSCKGRTAIVYRLENGLVCKIPWKPEHKHLREEFKKAFIIEKRVFEELGTYPGIIQYHGPCNKAGMQDGLVLSQANCGDLQSYIDSEVKINEVLRKKWCVQIAKAVAYVHDQGIIHRNLSTTNVLVHQSKQDVDAYLADFGSSYCPKLGLYGDLLPDDPFFDPLLTKFDTPKVDVFSLGVILYIIMTGHYPFRTRPAPEDEEAYTYGEYVQKLYQEGKFPELSNVVFGNVIAGCCCERRFETAKEVVVALKADLHDMMA